MTKFPRDVPKRKVIKALVALGFAVIREGNHISMRRINPDGSKTPLTLPNHKEIKGSTLLLILRQTGIKRDEFLEAFSEI
ncbi:type II toxin-antitoxin system HicA family toxin, partial [Methanothrix sp.]|uniref:type II toxin-antitoxin system HicA family toxin n=1 Tax=Methanothrix sp. TaxID=90426 RepID=UPI00329A1EF2